MSKDDVPIVIHDIYLDDVTNVLQKFPNRKRKDGRYYVIDFTFEEIRTLKVTERFNPKTGKQVYPNRFPKNKSTGNTIGIYPEIKNLKFHYENGKDFSKIVLDILSYYGYKTKEDNCILQCFDSIELERIRKELNSELFLVQLMGSNENIQQLNHFATYANGIGPWYKLILAEIVDKNTPLLH